MDDESRRDTPQGSERERPGRKRVEDLEVFKLSHDLALEVIHSSESFEESSAPLATDLRRAAIAVSANLAEGSGRPTRNEYRSFVGIAQGSTAVVSYYLLLARDLGQIDEERCHYLREGYSRVAYMLSRFGQSMA